jgi:PIN domain nuclease of toxin-antitoxin system
VILLDTNALLWLERGHPRSRPLARFSQHLRISPASLLEIELLVEIGKLRRSAPIAALGEDPRWLVDDPPAVAWFLEALDLAWTRDPFDRLLVAHARYRGWRLASGDAALLAQLGAREVIEL